MNRIYFSHENYTKFPLAIKKAPKKIATILNVFRVHYTNLSPQFIKYDTEYFDEDGKQCFYPIPKAELILVLLDGFGCLFTALRRYKDDKWLWYSHLVGQKVEIKIIPPK